MAGKMLEMPKPDGAAPPPDGDSALLVVLDRVEQKLDRILAVLDGGETDATEPSEPPAPAGRPTVLPFGG